MAQFLRRPNGAAPTRVFSVERDDLVWYQRHPVTAEWLCETAWPDGKPRVTTTVLVFAEDGKLKAAVHDRDGHRSAFVSGDTWDGLWGALETALKEDLLGWRPDKKK